MFLWTIKATVVSLMLIALLHYIYNYAIVAFTSPAVKDLVERPKEEYETMMKTIQKEVAAPGAPEEVDMKSQLKEFLAGEMEARSSAKLG